MSVFEYKVVPAPMKGRKGKGAKGADGRFALALQTLMNDLAADGWEYLRADTLPSEERSGLTGSTTVFQNMLVFRRATALVAPVAAPEPTSAAADPASPARAETAARVAFPEPTQAPEARQQTTAAAAAAAAALSAYRETPAASKGASLGPARRDAEDTNVAAE